jgi:hypothetical protein
MSSRIRYTFFGVRLRKSRLISGSNYRFLRGAFTIFKRKKLWLRLEGAFWYAFGIAYGTLLDHLLPPPEGVLVTNF